jgi:DNA-binding transcriptional MerR regulator
MGAIRTNAAASMLGVSPNTLRSWEQRFGYPRPQRTEGGHRQFELAEIETLRQAFEETHNISSAISIARERGEGPSSPTRLRAAFATFDEERADRLLEESLTFRSVERTVETLLLPALELLYEDTPGTISAEPAQRAEEAVAIHSGAVSPEYCFAWRYAARWLACTQRLAAPATRAEGVLIVDACPQTDVGTVYVQALELFLRRRGLRVLTLPVAVEIARAGNALRALQPSALVLGGQGTSPDALGRLVYATRRASAGVRIFNYRDALPASSSTTVQRLSPTPTAAAEDLLLSVSQARRFERSQHAAQTAGVA